MIRQDVRMREQEYGNYDSPEIEKLHEEKRRFGPFYYRFSNGESPADCYDRASSFLETLYRSWEDNACENQVMVGHGMMILITIMRMFKYEVEEFITFESLKNCEFIVCERRSDDDPNYHISYTWSSGSDKLPGGLRRKPDVSPAEGVDIWNGDPDAPLLQNLIKSDA
eukprot:TRINITY_DN75712_c0_g1_i1.p1 TRINITY_DN75712_c0_g1~~TRINITY_DN75712_c0_g1_i1.p1  ORF type:complete len:168 (-),score=23.22 TRINITY_DN75712_c0_g1_i1:70-573(-)